MGERVSDETTVDASVGTVWNTITDLDAYPQWADGVLEAQVLTTDADGFPETARFRVDARVAEVTYTLRYTYDDDAVRWTLVEGETVSQLDGAYELSETPAGTHVRYSLELDVDMPLPGFLKKRAAKQILDQGLRGLKSRAEQA